MQLFSKITFFKNGKPLPCSIVRFSLEQIHTILSFQQYLCSCVEDPDTFLPLSQREWEFLLCHGAAFAVLPEEPQNGGFPAYLIGCLYPPDEENLGADIGLSPSELSHVAHLEIAMTHPDFRGFRIHSVMCRLCCDYLFSDGRTEFVMATVSPKNIPSRKALESAGLSCVLQKEKYGGKLRCIMMKHHDETSR